MASPPTDAPRATRSVSVLRASRMGNVPHHIMGGYGGGDHPFPFRTGQLSPPAPMVLRKRESRSPPAPTGGPGGSTHHGGPRAPSFFFIQRFGAWDGGIYVYLQP